VPWIARLRAAKFLGHVTRESVVFEYGVGWGWNLAALQCRQRLGHDIAPDLAPAVRALGVEFVADTRQVADGTVDVVICHHTLEHVADPLSTLAGFRRMLRPDGWLLLFVPFERERRYRTYRPDEPNHHLFSWNVQTAGNLVCDSGFSVLRAGLGRFGYDRFAAAAAVRLHAGESGFRLIRGLAHLLRPAWEVRVVGRRPAG
jgi:SAM-dependent methyltransferase